MSKNLFVDFHCHLDLYPAYENLIKDTEEARIYTLAVTTTPRAWPKNRDLTKGLRYVRPALGLHPQLVGKDTIKQLALWKKYLPEARYVGEVGLDASQDFVHTLNDQRKVFKHILSCCADLGGRVLSVHSVRSVDMILDITETYFPASKGRIVLHWFIGTLAQVKRAIELGCYFSVNAAMLRTERGRSLLQNIPLDRLLTETDGPFVAYKNRPSQPKDISDLVNTIGSLKNSSNTTIKRQILANLKKLLETTS